MISNWQYLPNLQVAVFIQQYVRRLQVSVYYSGRVQELECFQDLIDKVLHVLHGKLLLRANDPVHICFDQFADEVDITENVPKGRDHVVREDTIVQAYPSRGT